MSFVNIVSEFKNVFKQYNISKIFDYDLSRQEYAILKNIIEISRKKKDEPVWVSDIVEQSLVTPQAISKNLRSMESKGLIERFTNPRDRRMTGLKVSDYGNLVFGDTHSKIEKLYDNIFGEFESSEIEEMMKLAKKFQILYEENIKEMIDEKISRERRESNV